MADDNKAWRERQRQKMQDQRAEEAAAERLYTSSGSSSSSSSSSSGSGELYTPYYDADVASGWRTFGAVAVILAILAMFILSLILFNGGLSRGGAGILFTGGNCTCVGKAGKDGLNGRDGMDGMCADPCQDGTPGPAGQNGMCEFHPMCLMGPSGADGTNGTNGQDGICLTPCVNGTDGGQGLPGMDGVCAQPCINGTNGVDGVNGTDGVCDCFNTPIEVATLTVNNTLTIEGGSIMCPMGGTIDLNCLGINMSSCLDFSACDLQAMSLLLQGPISGALLQVGVGGDTAGNMVSRVFLGDNTVANFMLNLIRMFASTVTIAGDLLLRLESRQEVRIRTTGLQRPVIVSATGTIQGTAGTGLTLVNQFSGNAIFGNQATGGQTRIQSAASIQNTASTSYLVDAPDALFEDTFGGEKYLEFDSSQSYDINSTNTFPDLSKRSMIAWQDIIMVAGKRIIALDPSMNVELGSGILITEGRIESGPASDLTLDAAPGQNIVLDDDTTLTMGVLNGGAGVDLSLNAAVGQVIRLEDDVTTATGIFNCPVGGCQFNGNVRVDGNLDTLSGGDINAAGDVTATGACCTSDPRVKRNITKIPLVEGSSAVQRVMETPVYEFNYSEEYLKADRNAYAGTLRGFMADQVEKHFPYAVRRIKKQVGDVYMDDLMQLNLEMMLADLWASHQQLRLEVQELKKKI